MLTLTVTEDAESQCVKRVTHLKSGQTAVNLEIFHESTALDKLQSDTPLDGHVLCVLLYAMTMGMPLRVRGVLSQSFLRNVMELQRIWSSWRPHVYKQIDIEPDRVVDARRIFEKSRAVSAFSGGADATFTALSHTSLLPANQRFPLTDVLIVHGFDVELNRKHSYESLVERVHPLLDTLQLNVLLFRTNSKSLGIQDWEDSSMLQLGACLHMLSDQFDYALVGSSEPYNALVLPWGSSPVTDHLMSGDLLNIVHDGAGYSRTNKIEIISKFPVATKTLKVCWAGEDQSSNCGRCEKCLRTAMNFLAAGQPVPSSLGQSPSVSHILRMQIANPVQKAELRSLIVYAQRNGVRGSWLRALKIKLLLPNPRLYYWQFRQGTFGRHVHLKLKSVLRRLSKHFKLFKKYG